MKDKDVMILLGVVGVLLVARRATPTISHEERITADGVRYAKYNATRLANQTLGGRLYETVSNLNPWNVSDVNVGSRPTGISRAEEKKLYLKHLNASTTKQEL